MKIKLVENVPVEGKHGMVKGKVLDVVEEDRGAYWVKGCDGERVKIWGRECVVIGENE